MNRIVFPVALCITVGAGAVGVLWSSHTMKFTEDQLNACAAEAMVDEMIKEGKSREVAEESAAVQGYYDILGTARAYQRRFAGLGLKTIYDHWADAAPKICERHVARGEAITMPDYGPRPGYHIVRSPAGSASAVRDGDDDPIFRCADGYRYSGMAWRPDGSGGCKPN